MINNVEYRYLQKNHNNLYLLYFCNVKKINVKNLDILFLDYLFFLLLDNLSFGLPVNLILFFVNDKSKI